ncbi:hypothetical protein PSN_3257 [Pseudomonas sp. NGC7]
MGDGFIQHLCLSTHRLTKGGFYINFMNLLFDLASSHPTT